MHQNSGKKLTFEKQLKLLGWFFVIIIPSILISYTYISSYVNSQKVTFDDTSTQITDFVQIDDLVDINLVVEWISFDKPIRDSQNELSNGSYVFHISYVNDTNHPIYNVYVLPVLQTDWANISEKGELKPISPTSVTNFQINFNHLLPLKPLYFVKVEEPILYLKISYQIEVSGQLVTKIKYVEYLLDNVYPIN